MCRCEKPNVNGQPGYSWDGTPGICPINPPDLRDGDELIYDEPGRCDGIDSHCHHFRVVNRNYGELVLLVRNGNGDHSFPLRRTQSYPRNSIKLALDAVPDSNARYWLLQNLYHMMSAVKSEATSIERGKWNKAIRENRLKIRSKKGVKYADILPEQSPTVTV